jgi:hypothetical protein
LLPRQLRLGLSDRRRKPRCAFLTDRAPARPDRAPVEGDVPVPSTHRIEMIRRSPRGHGFAVFGGKVQPISALPDCPVKTTNNNPHREEREGENQKTE